MQLQIFHTNDLHSHFEKLPQIKSCMLAHKKANTLILDGGDFHDMSSLTLVGSNAKAGAKLLNACGYDAMTLGNNDLWSGEGNFENIITNPLVDVVACNVQYLSEKAIPLKRSVIKQVGELYVCIIGVSVGEDSYNQFSHLFGLHVQEPFSCIQQEIDAHLADLYILISHMGIDMDRKAAQCLPIDIIIGAHSHTLMDQVECVHGTYIHQVGAYGQYVGELLIELENKKIKHVDAHAYEVDHYVQDMQCLKIIQSEERKAHKKLCVPYVQLPFELEHDLVKENKASNFLADVSLQIMPADLAIANSGLLLHGFPLTLSRADIYSAAPSPLNISRAYVKGEKLLQAIELSLNPQHCCKKIKAAGFRGQYIGTLAFSSNVQIMIQKNKPLVMINGQVLDQTKKYWVCANDFLFRGSGYPSLYSVDHLEFDSHMIKDALLMYIGDQELLKQAKLNRIMTIYS